MTFKMYSPYVVSIFVPSTNGDERIADVDHHARARHAALFLGNLFGGATVQLAEGIWHDHNGGIVEEPVYVAWSYADEKTFNDDPLITAKVGAYCTNRCIDWQQQEVMYSIVRTDGRVVFVNPGSTFIVGKS